MELGFRVCLIALFVVSAMIAGFHRWRAARSGKSFRREDGEHFVLRILLQCSGLGLFVVSLATLMNPLWFGFATFKVPILVRVLGAILGWAGVVGMHRTLAGLGDNLTDTIALRERSHLVVSGPYCWVRHPYYVFASWIMMSVTAVSQNMLIGVLSLLVVALLLLRTPSEERKLEEEFGEAYRDYQRTTGMFVPRWFRR